MNRADGNALIPALVPSTAVLDSLHARMPDSYHLPFLRPWGQLPHRSIGRISALSERVGHGQCRPVEAKSKPMTYFPIFLGAFATRCPSLRNTWARDLLLQRRSEEHSNGASSLDGYTHRSRFLLLRGLAPCLSRDEFSLSVSNGQVQQR